MDASLMRLVAGGLLAMVLSTGIARFAFTPLLPPMQQETGFGAVEAGWLAAAHYAGYLLGALGCMKPLSLEMRHRLVLLSLAVCVVTTAAMVLPLGMVGWGVIRFLAGLGSAGIFVLASALVGTALAQRGAEKWMGIHFSGVGLGIALSGTVSALVVPGQGASGGWLVLAVAGLAAATLAWVWHPHPRAAGPAHAAPPVRQRPYPFAFLLIAYLCMGLGYVVTATFLVAMLRDTLGGGLMGDLAWVVVGLAAAPSTILWALAADRHGFDKALTAAYLLMTLGILLPVASTHSAAILAGSILFGGTFMGIAGMTLAFGRRIGGPDAARVMGVLTVAFGLGQIIGPAVAGWIAESHGYRPAMLAAAAISLIGGAIMALGMVRGRTAALPQ